MPLTRGRKASRGKNNPVARNTRETVRIDSASENNLGPARAPDNAIPGSAIVSSSDINTNSTRSTPGDRSWIGGSLERDNMM